MVVKQVLKPKKTLRGDDAFGDWEVVDAKRETYQLERPIDSDEDL